MNTSRTLVICDDDPLFHSAVTLVLRNKFQLLSTYTGEEAVKAVSTINVDIVLLDLRLTTELEGISTLKRIRELDPNVAVVMVSGNTDFENVRDAMFHGATDYVAKNAEPDILEHHIEQALKKSQLLRRAGQIQFEVNSLQTQHVLVGKSEKLLQLRQVIAKLRNTPVNVMITGETGSGKEVVARSIRSTLPDGTLEPFVAVDSSTIQSTMAESILFGHERGAFTGAEKPSKGVFEEAHGGIVYFDEISNMPIDIQAKLLRVLQEKEVKRLGSNKVLPLDFKVICASNKHLENEVKQGRFKEDLYQRLNVIPIHIPTLRERIEDLPDLLNHFLRRHCRGEQKRLSDPAVEALKNYSWPGNVREVSNLIAYLVTMVEGPLIEVKDLPVRIRPLSSSASLDQTLDYYSRVEDFERQLLAQEYGTFSGNISRMAAALKMDRSHLHAKLKRYHIHLRA